MNKLMKLIMSQCKLTRLQLVYCSNTDNNYEEKNKTY